MNRELFLEEAKDIIEHFDAVKEVKYDDDDLLKIGIIVDGKLCFFDYNDVVNFYRRYANDSISTIRELGAISGDWRPITHIADYIKEVFKALKEANIPFWIMEEEANEEDNHG